MQFQNTLSIHINTLWPFHFNRLNSLLFFLFKKNNIENIQITRSNLPKSIKKFTLLKSPHVYKTARTQVEIRRYQQVITLTNLTKTDKKLLSHILSYWTTQLLTNNRLHLKQKQLIFINI